MRISETAVASHGARFDSSSVAIVEFILASLPQKGTPSQVLFTLLQSCFTLNPTHLKHFKIEFNLDPSDLASHEKKVANLLKSLNR